MRLLVLWNVKGGVSKLLMWTVKKFTMPNKKYIQRGNYCLVFSKILFKLFLIHYHFQIKGRVKNCIISPDSHSHTHSLQSSALRRHSEFENRSKLIDRMLTTLHGWWGGAKSQSHLHSWFAFIWLETHLCNHLVWISLSYVLSHIL